MPTRGTRDHRDKNFTDRLEECRGTEKDPELDTPMTAGAEELTEYETVFPLTKQFRQTNMRSTRGVRRGSQSQRGKDQD